MPVLSARGNYMGWTGSEGPCTLPLNSLLGSLGGRFPILGKHGRNIGVSGVAREGCRSYSVNHSIELSIT